MLTNEASQAGVGRQSMAVEVAQARRLFTRAEYHRMAEVATEDVLLLIEVAESSLPYDRSTKRRLYAAAGIPEYWLVDCAAESVEVFRAPNADGYREVSRVAGVATLNLQAVPDVSVTLAEIFE